MIASIGLAIHDPRTVERFFHAEDMVGSPTE